MTAVWYGFFISAFILRPLRDDEKIPLPSHRLVNDAPVNLDVAEEDKPKKKHKKDKEKKKDKKSKDSKTKVSFKLPIYKIIQPYGRSLIENVFSFLNISCLKHYSRQ